MNEEKLISVVMPNYNKADVLAESIQSVLSQTYHNIQFIIIDDGSTDQSPSIIRKYAEKDSRIEYILCEKNQQICAACNLGLSKVRGEYIARMDSDDLWETDKLERQLKYMESQENCQICFTGVSLIDEFGNSLDEADPEFAALLNQPAKMREENLRFFFEYGNYLAHPSVMMKTEFQRQLGGYNLAYCQAQDFDYWIRAVKRTDLHKMPEKLLKLRRFVQNPEKNLSARTEQPTIRWYNEYMMIRSHFFDDMTDELFERTFRPVFRNPSAGTPEEYACEKAFLLRDQSKFAGRQYPVLGMLALEQLFRSEKTRQVLKETYHYSLLDFYEEMKRSVFLNPYVDQKIEMCAGLQQEKAETEKRLQSCRDIVEKQDQEIAVLKVQNQELSKSLEIIQNSACWKITAPVRKVLDRIKSK